MVKLVTDTNLTASVNAAVAALVAGAPGALDTLNELATALGDDANFAATVTTALGNRLTWRGAWAPATNYVTNDVVTFNGGLYRAPNNFTSAGAFVLANWVELHAQTGTYASVNPTTIKTAAYAANFNEVVLTNPSSAAAVVPITLPTIGQGRGSVTVKRVDTPSPGRTDTGCGTTSGSPVITDAAITAADVGRSVTYVNGIPAGLYVGTVIAGVSFRLSYSPTAQFDANATATGTVSVALGDLPNLYGTSVIGPMDDGTTNDALNDFLESVMYVLNDPAAPTAWVRV